MQTDLWGSKHQSLSGVGAGRGRRVTQGHEETLGLMEMFIILIVRIVSLVCAFVKMIRLYSFSACIF